MHSNSKEGRACYFSHRCLGQGLMLPMLLLLLLLLDLVDCMCQSRTLLLQCLPF
jgi:hypothetical protein